MVLPRHTVLGSALMFALSFGSALPVSIAQAKQTVREVDLTSDKVTSSQLTVYPSQAVVSQTLSAPLPVGRSQLYLQADFQNWVPETLLISAGSGNKTFSPQRQSWRQPVTSRESMLQEMVGQKVELFRPGRSGPLIGLLQVWDGETGLLLLNDQKQEMFRWEPGYALRTYDRQPISPGLLRPAIHAHFQLSQAVEQVNLSYITQGLGYSHQYRLELHPEEKLANLRLTSSIRNQTGTSYMGSQLQLASGDVGRVSVPEQYAMQRKAASMAMDSEPRNTRAGSLLFTSVPGAFDLPANSSLTLPLFEQKGLSYETFYRYEFYGSYHRGSRGEKGNPTQKVVFTPSQDLPEGAVQVYETDDSAPLRLIHQSTLTQTAEDDELELSLGSSYTLTLERRQLARRQQGDKVEIDWQLLVSSQQVSSARLLIDDTAANLVSLTQLKGIQKDGEQLFANIPAGKTVTLGFTSVYQKN